MCKQTTKKKTATKSTLSLANSANCKKKHIQMNYCKALNNFYRLESIIVNLRHITRNLAINSTKLANNLHCFANIVQKLINENQEAKA